MTKRLLLSSLQPGTQYIVQVRSRTNDNSSPWSQVLTFTTEMDSLAPDAPTGASWVVEGSNFVGTWNGINLDGSVPNNNDFDHYEISITAGATTIKYTVPAGTHRFDFLLEDNKSAFGGTPEPSLIFSVKSVDKLGNQSASTAPIAATNPAPSPVSPVVSNGAEQIILDWVAPADADLVGYNIYASQTLGFTPGPGNKISATPSLSYTLSTISTSPWYFHVKSVDVFGQESTSTEVTGTAKAVTLTDLDAPAPPTGVGVTAFYDGTLSSSLIAVTWTLSADDGAGDNDVREYTIRYTLDGGTLYDYISVDGGETGAVFPVLPNADYDVSVRTRDFSGNSSAWVDATPNPIHTPTDTAPSDPAAPTAVGNTMQVMVSHNNLRADNVTPMQANTVAYEVYAQKTDTWTVYNSTNLIGKLFVTNVTSSTFPLPVTTTSGTVADTWYIRVKAVARGGLASGPSASTTVVPGLIQNTNIIDATIQSAKIVSLVADKITAGSGIIASLTIGNATTAGDIHSFDYVANTTGWKIGGTSGGVNTLEINNGLIKARTLELSNSGNLIPGIYADFEAATRSYTGTLATSGSISAVLSTSAGNVKYGTQGLVVTHGVNGQLWLGSSLTTAACNIPVEAGKTYIVSGYFGGTSTVQWFMFWNNGGSTAGPSFACTGTLTRQSTSFTVPAGVTKAMLVFVGLNAAAWAMDGLQVEEKTGATNTPQPWRPPGFTTIDGGQIKTGSIQSTTTITSGGATAVPLWYIDIAGSAQFANAKILGTLTVGGAAVAGSGTDTTTASVVSQNFIANTSGWKIDAAGNAELNSAIIRGQLSTGTITGDLTMSGGSIRTSAAIGPVTATAPGAILNSSGLRAYGTTGVIVDYLNIETVKDFAFTSTGKTVVLTSSTTGTSPKITIYNGDVWESEFVPASTVNAWKIAVDGSNNIYVLDESATPRVRKYDLTGTLLLTFTVASSTSLANLDVDPTGRLYLAYDQQYIRKYNATGTLVTTVDLGAGVGMGSITADETGFWISRNNQIVQYTNAGVATGVTITGPDTFEYYQSLTMDASGNLYAYYYDGTTTLIKKYSSAGVLLQTYQALDMFTDYRSIRLDPSNNVYVQSAVSIIKWTSNNDLSVNINTTTGQLTAATLNVDGVINTSNILVSGIIEAKKIIGNGTGFRIDDQTYIKLTAVAGFGEGAGPSYLQLNGGTSVTLASGYGPKVVMGSTSMSLYADSGGYIVNVQDDGDVVFGRHNTTTNSTNMNMLTSGTIRRVTSTRASKVDIMAIDMEPKDILKVEAVQWHDRQEMERFNNLEANPMYGESNVTPPKWIPGVVAEQLEEAGLTVFVDYDLEGKPYGVKYDRLIAAVIPLLKEHDDRLNALEGN